MLNVVLLNKNKGWISQPDLQFEVESITSNINGGSELAVLSLNERNSITDDLPGLLRNGIEIYNGNNRLVWCGYINTIIYQNENNRITCSLDEMANKVQVVFEPFEPISGEDQPVRTAWFESPSSKLEYGTKEAVIQWNNSETQSMATRAVNIIQAIKRPRLKYQDKGGKYGIKIICNGWHKSLGWKYYQTTAGRIYTQGEVAKAQVMGSATANTYVGMAFTNENETEYAYVDVYLQRASYVADDLKVDIYLADANDEPTGASLAECTVSSATIDFTRMKRMRVIFDVPATLETDKRYFIRFSRTGALHLARCYYIGLDQAGISGQAKLGTGSAWDLLVPGQAVVMEMVGIKEITAQIESIFTACNQFIKGIKVIDVTDIFTCPYEQRDITGEEKIKQLMKASTQTMLGLRSWVDGEYYLNIDTVPEPGLMDCFTDMKGNYFDNRRVPFDEGVLPVGQWLSVDESEVNRPQSDVVRNNVGLIEQMTYYPGENKIITHIMEFLK